MKKIFLLIFIAATLSCGHKNRIKIEDVNQNSIEKNRTPQCLDLENAIKGEYDSQPLNTFIDTVKYIALETNQACLVGRINKVLYYKDCFYVGNFNVLLKFNSKGKFICQIGKKGKGPREYLQMRDVIIHSDSIYINGRHKILVFNLDGEYLTGFPFPADVIDFEKLDDTFVSYNKETGNLMFLNYNNGHIIDTIEYEKIEGKRIPVLVVYPHDNLFFQNSKMFCINTGHNDTIHEIDNLHRLIPRYIINLGKFKLPDKYRVEFVNLDKFDKLSAAYIRPVLIETNNLLFVQFNRWLNNSNIKPLGLYDEKTGSLGLGVLEKHNSRFSIISQENTERYIPCFYPYFSDGNEHLISYISAFDALEYYKQSKANPTLFKPFATLMRHTKESDNPIIIVAKVKNTTYEQR